MPPDRPTDVFGTEVGPSLKSRVCYARGMAVRLNPFVPGRGAMPPHLAGRAAEKRALKGMLAYLRAGRGAARDAVLCGPRGNGKTVLLRWFQQEVEAIGGIDLVWRAPSDLPSVDALATMFVPPARFKAMLPSTLSLSVGLGRVGWELGNNPGTLHELLTARCRQRPLVVLLDEAHTLSPDTGRALLNASQSVSASAPFLLVLAGTPGLVPHLDSMSPTFWDRAEQLPIGLLERSAAAEALLRPFEAGAPSVTIDPAVLERAVEESQCYPYFLQLHGAALWDATPANQSAVGEDALQRASEVFRRRRETYYQHRYNELQRAGLLDVASAIASAFAVRASIAQGEVDAAIEAALSSSPPSIAPKSVFDSRDALAAVGYIWNPAGERDRWRPGIPSLMAYVKSLAPSPRYPR